MKKSEFNKLKWSVSEPQKREEFEFHKMEIDETIVCIDPRIVKISNGQGGKVENLLVTDDNGNDLCLGSYHNLVKYFKEQEDSKVPWGTALAFKITYVGDTELEPKKEGDEVRKVKNFAFQWAQI